MKKIVPILTVLFVGLCGVLLVFRTTRNASSQITHETEKTKQADERRRNLESFKTDDKSASFIDPNHQIKKPYERIEQLANLSNETVFVKISEFDQLTWQQVRDYIDALIDVRKINPPPGMDLSQDEIDDVRQNIFITTVNNVMRKYLRTAVIAHQARQEGFTVTEDDFFVAQTNAMATYRRRGAKAKNLLVNLNTRGSFFYSNTTNVILATKYFNKVIKPTVKPTDKDVRAIIDERLAYNASVAPSNHLVKAELQGILKRIRAREIEFGEAAEEFSEDGGDNGYFGIYEPGEGMSELEAVYSKMKKGEISDVVETPYSYHILRLLNITYAKDASGKDNRAEVDSYELAHIMLEKYQPKPEWKPDAAYEQAWNLNAAKKMGALQKKLLETHKIESVIPLTREPKKGKRVRSQQPATKIGDKQ